MKLYKLIFMKKTCNLYVIKSLYFYHKKIMDLLLSFYNNLKTLRNNGMKMKDIAEEMDITSSVLSSLFSTVLPKYSQLMEDGRTCDEALEEALLLVNNVSKRKLLSCLDDAYSISKEMLENTQIGKGNVKTVWSDLEKEYIRNKNQATSYTGVYTAYSKSSYCDGLKVEHYMISYSKDASSLVIYCQNMQGDTYTGTGIITTGQYGYLFLNEQNKLQITLKVVYLQMPMIEFPDQMKGLYMTHDFNQNPIARRVIFIRESNEISLEEFSKRKSQVIPKDEITDDLKQFYNYTCQKEDCIRSFSFSSPNNLEKDLILEKEFLKLL